MGDRIDRRTRAFPQDEPTAHDTPGMLLRDWFAGLAMQALVKDSGYSREVIPQVAYELADKMMLERDRGDER